MARVLVAHVGSVLGWDHVEGDVLSGYGVGGDVANGSFEEVAPFGGYGWRYKDQTGVRRVHAPGAAHQGSYVLQLSDGASSHQPMPARAGESFTITAWMRGASGGHQAHITLDFRDQEIWTAPLQSTTQTVTLTTAWQEYTLTATAPSRTPNPVFHARVTFEAGGGDTVEIDRVSSARTAGARPADRQRLQQRP